MLTKLSIIGSTATGKTKLALQLTKVLENTGIDIISADSRQIYQGMEIGTGVDVPGQWQRASHHSNQPFVFDKDRWYGVSMVKPDQAWSVADFATFAKPIIENSQVQGRLPILVGGTGLYHRFLEFAKNEETALQPADPELRQKAATMTVDELQTLLAKKDLIVLEQMNNSDRNNPRRLVRALERGSVSSVSSPKKSDHMTIGLTAPVEYLAEKIEARILDRMEHGMLEEVQNLMADYSDEIWKMPAFSATGYREVRAFLEDKIDRQQLIELWLRHELQYAKRQQTWWKKYGSAKWFDVTESDWHQRALADILSS